MTPPLTATATRTINACVLCAAELPHTRHDRALPVAQRTTVRVAPALHEYLPYPGENDRYPSL